MINDNDGDAVDDDDDDDVDDEDDVDDDDDEKAAAERSTHQFLDKMQDQCLRRFKPHRQSAEKSLKHSFH